MKQPIYLLMFFMLLVTACGKKSSSMTDEEKISGTEAKTWKATKATDPSGGKDRISHSDHKESITFSRNGAVKMGDDENTKTGKWSYNNNTLSLQLEGDNHTEDFTVLKLDDDEMQLKAEDGSELTMKPK